ncbi:hypothetical protein [Spirosoma linguale]|uniref:Secretion system C-terminal sorting domain-containing protein n=1 Tax=Spirosoma linguale (strain ATCC 33905 / DSM 74 / LMG 10896 / Claus 1) TaxID=504472 RepID=D2QM83_SPILD|nr:hypothetical protein Slin_3135 [Spirosoma linguale DSM 74]
MSVNRFLPTFDTRVILIALFLYAPFLRAQTFTGQPKLTTLPASFEAMVYPSTTQPSTVRVVFNNPTGGSVRVQIENTEGQIFYDAHETIKQYRRRFDLATLPEGNYTIVLSKQNSRYAQAFVIDPPARPQNQVTLISPYARKASGKKIVVSDY